MEVRIDDVGPCKKSLSIKVPPERIQEEVEKNLTELSETVRFPGFRPGKAPRALVEKKFRKDVLDEVKGELVRESLTEALKENDLDVLALPDVDKVEMDEQTGLSYEATVELKPRITMGEYKGVELEKESTEVADKDVDEFVMGLRRQHGRMEDAPEGKADDNSWVRADCEILVSGEKVWNREGIVFGVEEEMVLGLQIEGLKKSISGKTIGDELELDVTLPDGFFIEEHAGKSATLKIKITEVRVLVPAELNEAMLQRVGASDEEELRSMVRTNLVSNREMQAQRNLRQQLMDKLIDSAEVEMSEDVVERVAGDIIERQKRRAQMYGQTIDDADEALKAETREQARREVIWHFMLEQIAEKEKVFATEDDVEAEIARMAAQTGRRPTVVRNELERAERLSELRGDVRRQKTVNLLIDKATIKES